MLDERGIIYRYREYTEEPLSRDELEHLFARLDATPAEALRRRDPAAKQLGLRGDETDAVLIDHMAAHPTLLQRPIGIVGERATLGRPIERLLELVDTAAG